MARAAAAFRQPALGDKGLPECSGQSKERTGMRSMHEILPLPACSWQEPCGLRYSENNHGERSTIPAETRSSAL
jgi:hypothetical protein